MQEHQLNESNQDFSRVQYSAFSSTPKHIEMHQEHPLQAHFNPTHKPRQNPPRLEPVITVNGATQVVAGTNAVKNSAMPTHINLLNYLKRRHLFLVLSNRPTQERAFCLSLLNLNSNQHIKTFITKIYSKEDNIDFPEAFYNRALADLRRLFNYAIEEELRLMPAEETQQYRQCAEKNAQCVRDNTKLIAFSTNGNYFNMATMFKIDVLANFLKANQEYSTYYPTGSVTVISSTAFIGLFRISQAKFQFYKRKFDAIEVGLQAYRPLGLALQEILLIFTMVELYLKICDYKDTFSPDLAKLRSEMKKVVDFKPPPPADDNERYQPFQLRFSDLAFSYYDFQRHADQESNQIIMHRISKLHFTSNRQRNLALLQVHSQSHAFSFKSVINVYIRMQAGNSIPKSVQKKRTPEKKCVMEEILLIKSMNKQYKSANKSTQKKKRNKANNFSKLIKRYQWKCLKSQDFGGKLSKLAGRTLTCIDDYFKNGLSDVFCEIFETAVNRFKTVGRVFQAMHLLESKWFNRQHIYIKKFYYFSPIFQVQGKDIIQDEMEEQWSNISERKILSDEEEELEEYTDKVGTLIVAIWNKKVIYSCVVKKKIDDYEYCYILKNNLHRKIQRSLGEGNFNIVFDEFHPNNHVNILPFLDFNVYCYNKWNSRVYFAFAPNLFETHLIIDAFIKTCLSSIHSAEDILSIVNYIEDAPEKVKSVGQNECNKWNQMFKEATQSKKWEIKLKQPTRTQIESLNYIFKYSKHILNAIESYSFIGIGEQLTFQEIKEIMRKFRMTLKSLEQIIEVSAKTLLSYQVFYKRMVVDIRNQGKSKQVKNNFYNEVQFLSRLFIYENEEINLLFPEQQKQLISSIVENAHTNPKEYDFDGLYFEANVLQTPPTTMNRQQQSEAIFTLTFEDNSYFNFTPQFEFSMSKPIKQFNNKLFPKFYAQQEKKIQAIQAKAAFVPAMQVDQEKQERQKDKSEHIQQEQKMQGQQKNMEQEVQQDEIEGAEAMQQQEQESYLYQEQDDD